MQGLQLGEKSEICEKSPVVVSRGVGPCRIVSPLCHVVSLPPAFILLSFPLCSIAFQPSDRGWFAIVPPAHSFGNNGTCLVLKMAYSRE